MTRNHHWLVRNIVRIKLSPSKKRYLKGKHVYDYIRAHLPIPHKFFKTLEPYLKEDFQVIKIDVENKITLCYTYWKKFEVAREKNVEKNAVLSDKTARIIKEALRKKLS